MWERIVRWFCPIAGEYWFGLPPAAPCDSMDMVRKSAGEFIDALEAAAEQGYQTGDGERLRQLDALAGYLEGELQRFRERHFST